MGSEVYLAAIDSFQLTASAGPGGRNTSGKRSSEKESERNQGYGNRAELKLLGPEFYGNPLESGRSPDLFFNSVTKSDIIIPYINKNRVNLTRILTVSMSDSAQLMFRVSMP